MLKNLLWALPFFFVIMSSCGKPEIPEYVAFENFNMEKMDWNESVVSADLKYYNPNKYSLKLSKADINIYLENQYVGNTILDTLINIPKLDTFYVPVKIKVDSKSILNNALNILFNHEITFRLQGTARFGRSGVFMSMPVFYEGKQKISL